MSLVQLKVSSFCRHEGDVAERSIRESTELYFDKGKNLSKDTEITCRETPLLVAIR